MKQLESTSMVLLRHHLKALRLPTITAECEKLARQAAADNADHLTYLLQLTEPSSWSASARPPSGA